MANIVLDDTQISYKLGGGTWSSVSIERFFGGEAIWPAFAGDSTKPTDPYGWISFQFQGTGISLYGNPPSDSSASNFAVSFDGANPTTVSYPTSDHPTSLTWYKSPTLSEGTHTINITHLAGTSVDFAVIQAGPSTPLKNTTLIVDDGDSSISYDGSWNQVFAEYNSRDNPHQGWPYGNGTHRATSAGPSATFKFTGTSVAVWNIFNWAQLGTMTVKYTLDGSDQTLNYNVDASTQGHIDGLLERENTLMFSSNSLSAGDHTLQIQVTACSGQTFALDYITYKPSFDTLLSKPALTPTTTSGSSVSPSGSATSLIPGSVIGSGSASGTTSGSSSSNTGTTNGSGSSNNGGSSNSGDNNSIGASKKTNTGAIAGGVVGGVLALLALALLLLFLKKRKQRAEAAALDKEAPPTVEPFVSSQAATGAASDSATAVSDVKPPLIGRYTGPDAAPSDRSASPLLVPLRHNPGAAREKAALALVNASSPTDNSSTMSSGGGADPLLVGRMQRLQDLVTELNRELAHGGESSPRVAELRGRISELTREDTQSAQYVAQNMSLRHQSAIPPPYETA